MPRRSRCWSTSRRACSSRSAARSPSTAPLDVPPPAPSPCDSCAGQPCRTACPVDALSPAGLDAPRCHGYLDTRGRPGLPGARLRRAPRLPGRRRPARCRRSPRSTWRPITDETPDPDAPRQVRLARGRARRPRAPAERARPAGRAGDRPLAARSTATCRTRCCARRARRTRETWDLLGLDDAGARYLAEACTTRRPARSWSVLQRRRGARRVLIIGHNPGIGGACRRPAGASRAEHPRVRPLIRPRADGGLRLRHRRLEPTLRPGAGTIIDFVVPKDL